MGFLAGDYTPHPNSLMFNGIPIFWPFKAFWFCRKFGEILILKDFPTPPEGHEDNKHPRKYFSLPKFHH